MRYVVGTLGDLRYSAKPISNQGINVEHPLSMMHANVGLAERVHIEEQQYLRFSFARDTLVNNSQQVVLNVIFSDNVHTRTEMLGVRCVGGATFNARAEMEPLHGFVFFGGEGVHSIGAPAR